jgi:hypothetical protein
MKILNKEIMKQVPIHIWHKFTVQIRIQICDPVWFKVRDPVANQIKHFQ